MEQISCYLLTVLERPGGARVYPQKCPMIQYTFFLLSVHLIGTVCPRHRHSRWHQMTMMMTTTIKNSGKNTQHSFHRVRRRTEYARNGKRSRQLPNGSFARHQQRQPTEMSVFKRRRRRRKEDRGQTERWSAQNQFYRTSSAYKILKLSMSVVNEKCKNPNKTWTNSSKMEE